MERQPNKAFANIRSSAIDGRVHNPFFRRDQLKKLHNSLVQNASKLQDAMEEDGVLTPTESKIEYCLALQCIAEVHDDIDPRKALEAEYAIANGVDAPSSRQPIGVVVIEPSLYGFLYSLVAAVAPAIAGGNCIIIQMGHSLRRTPQLVLDIVCDALDGDIFSVTKKPTTAADIGHPHVRVAQESSEDNQETRRQLSSSSTTPVIALVERDAQLDEAAKSLVVARFSRGGRAPYAPDIIFVNEWVKRPFLEAVVRQKVAMTSASADTSSRVERAKPRGPLYTKEVEDGDVVLISSGAGGSIVEVCNRSSPLVGRKAQQSCLVVLSVRSIDDAIDMTGRYGQPAAAYVFATPPAAKYFCQFVKASVSFINHIPTKLLSGPMAPEGHPPDNVTCNIYTPKLFTTPQAQYITSSGINRRFDEIAKCQLTGEASASLDELVAEASAPLVDVKRPSHVSPIGFFEQGIITGLTLTLTTVLGGLGVAGYFLIRGYHSSSL